MTEFDDDVSLDIDFDNSIRFKIFKDFYVFIRFNIYQKRLELDFYKWQKSVNIYKIVEFIEKRNGLQIGKKKTTHNSVYSLKYSARNCQRLVDIFTSLYAEYFSETRKKMNDI